MGFRGFTFEVTALTLKTDTFLCVSVQMITDLLMTQLTTAKNVSANSLSGNLTQHQIKRKLNYCFIILLKCPVPGCIVIIRRLNSKSLHASITETLLKVCSLHTFNRCCSCGQLMWPPRVKPSLCLTMQSFTLVSFLSLKTDWTDN